MRHSSTRILLLACQLFAGCTSLVALGQEASTTAGAGDQVRLAGLPWQMHVVDDELRGADGAKLADVNGDGLPDIVTGWEESGRTRAYFHPGVARVHEIWPHVSLGATPSVEDAVWVDLNSDGRLDVLSCCEGKDKTLYVHWAPRADADWMDANSWKRAAIPASQGLTRWMYAEPLTTQDSSSDRSDVAGLKKDRVDVVVASKDPQGQLSILTVVAGDLESATIAPLVDAQWIMSVEVLDVDGDGDEDILYSDRKGPKSGVFWLENTDANVPADQKTKWSRHVIGGLGREVMFLSLGVTTGGTAGIGDDSRVALESIYVPAKPNTVFVFGRDTQSKAVRWTSTQFLVEPAEAIGFAKSVAAVSLDDDPELEVVFACESAFAPKVGVCYLDFNGSTWETKNISGDRGIKFDALQAVDLDRDGDLDILTCEEREQGRGLGLIWYENPN